ncbi:MAG: PAS domain-containing protein [Verrucomicrobia bacterium]|nr:PAS domain-containing protein [Verrucomicrobiota bacterium]MDE3046906.1 PAS domain-containing protein [Verrucomicrobiota bacterium]
MKKDSITSELNLYKPIAEAVSLLLFPHAEVVIHNFKTKCIGAIFNNLSKRKIGDESLLDENEQLSDSQDVFPPYFKINWDGRRMKSVSAVLKNKAGKPIGLLCINLDISKWEQMHDLIRGLIESKVEQPDFLFKNDWREKINVYVSTYLKNHGLCLEALDRVEKQKLLFELKKEGAFETKNAASYVADVLQISRATVYNYLKEKP